MLWIVRLNTDNLSILSKLTYQFTAFPIKMQDLIVKTCLLILTFVGRFEGPKIIKITLRKNKIDESTASVFKTHKAALFSAMWYKCRDK